MLRLGLIGAGGMAETVLSALADTLPSKLLHLSFLVRPGRQDSAHAIAARWPIAAASAVHTDAAGLLSDTPDLVAECAGHQAVRAHAAGILRGGCDLIVISSGALADDALLQQLRDAARAGGSRIVLPAGAVGAMDALAAMRLSGLRQVTYVGRKPPQAWRGTAAERVVDLTNLTHPVTFYRGTARDAARDYPQNANVAATVALAGDGFDRTRVELVADPHVSRNVHEIAVQAACADFAIRLEGHPSPGNPRTSLTAGYSVARAVLNRSDTLVI